MKKPILIIGKNTAETTSWASRIINNEGYKLEEIMVDPTHLADTTDELKTRIVNSQTKVILMGIKKIEYCFIAKMALGNMRRKEVLTNPKSPFMTIECDVHIQLILVVVDRDILKPSDLARDIQESFEVVMDPPVTKKEVRMYFDPKDYQA